ncbi:MAG: nucleotidyltransferase family protein [Armatimonadetes bacterium]|nr:nucleotidyltransferase family protein [Armatimonadota bacterium]
MAKKVTAVVLAAGLSERMGEFKLLLPFRGKTVIETLVDTLLELPLRGVWVVLGHRAEDVAAALVDRPAERIVNLDYEEGMLSSIQCGFGMVPDEADGILLCLGDQPWLSPKVVRALLETFESADRGILIPAFNGRRGHPILIAMRYRDEVLDLEDSGGLRQLHEAHPDDILEAPVGDESILSDMDLPEDYDRAVAREG